MPELRSILQRLAMEPTRLVQHPLIERCSHLEGLWPLLDALVPVFCQIRDRQGRLVPLVQNAVQRDYAQRRTARNLILKARQVGMTTYIAARFFLRTISTPGTVTLQVAHSLESAEQIFRIVRRFFDTLDDDVRRALKPTRTNARELAFAGTDSRYLVDTAGNRHAGRGLTIHCLHASEVAQWPGNAGETLAGLLGAVAPGGWVDLESTPRGSGSLFHRLWTDAASWPGYTRHFFPWWLEPAYTLAPAPGESLEPLSEEEHFLVERHRLTPGQILYRRYLQNTFGVLARQEFVETDVDCFLSAGRPVFEIAAIEARLRRLPKPVERHANGAELIWFPPQAGRDYVLGADVAEGTEHGDYSAAVVLDAATGLQCAEIFARWPLRQFAEALDRMGRRYNFALMAIERNNHGHAVLYALRHQFHYPRIYHHPEPGVNPTATKAGWPMNLQTKPQVVGALQLALEQTPEIICSARLLEQCRSFVYREDGEMGALAGMHDDLVTAMGIALVVRARTAAATLTSAAVRVPVPW